MAALAPWIANFVTGTLASILVGILNSFGWRKLILRVLIATARAAEERCKDWKAVADILDGVADGLQDVLDKDK